MIRILIAGYIGVFSSFSFAASDAAFEEDQTFVRSRAVSRERLPESEQLAAKRARPEHPEIITNRAGSSFQTPARAPDVDTHFRLQTAEGYIMQMIASSPLLVVTPGSNHRVKMVGSRADVSVGLSAADNRLHSTAPGSIYLISDVEMQVPRLDLGGFKVSEQEFAQYARSTFTRLRLSLLTSRTGNFGGIPRYIGKVSAGKHGDRKPIDRAFEHAQAIVKTVLNEGKNSEREAALYQYIYQGFSSAREDVSTFYFQTLVVGIHPDNLNDIEAWLIAFLETLSGNGLNSRREFSLWNTRELFRNIGGGDEASAW